MQIEVEKLTKVFDRFKAVDEISFVVNEGEVVGLVGPNGAGKTTTIHLILGLISPTAGDIRIFGKRLEKHRQSILSIMNFTAPYVAYPPRLTVWENLMVFAKLYNVRQASLTIAKLLKEFGIEYCKDRPVSKLSSGENTRVGLCKAFLNNPKLLLMDEPTTYLDPQLARHVKQVISDIRQRLGTTILYTSHNMREVEEVCSRIYFLDRGRIIASGSPLQVTRQILNEERTIPALEEVFLRIAGCQTHEMA